MVDNEQRKDRTEDDQSDQQEPSMEEILSSIRRILAEEENVEGGSESAPSPARPAQSDPSEPEPADASADDPGGEVDDSGIELIDEDVEEEMVEAVREDPTAGAENVLLLSPEMRTSTRHRVVTASAAAASTDILAQLAKAILDQRDLGLGRRDVTIEGMVREMLRPLLKEWLDRNLPYLIERLVKREIDLMINRAERLED